MKKKISAEIIADSINLNGNRVTTFLLTYPRFIHGEILTHRLFSRNSASSRAIPFKAMVKSIEEDPFIPIAWQKDHKGMQGVEYFTDSKDVKSNIEGWISAAEDAAMAANNLNYSGLTKQLCNRLLEPFAWHTVLVTATEYSNFFDLRLPKYVFHDEEKEYDFCSKKDVIKHFGENEVMEYSSGNVALKDLTDLDWIKLSTSGAEIHIQALAEAMWDAMGESTPVLLMAGEWHCPLFIPEGEVESIDLSDKIFDSELSLQDVLLKVSVARCARLSYMTFDKKVSYLKDIELHDMLLKSKHFSPFEHCCRPITDSDYYDGDGAIHEDVEGNQWSGNFKGFVQYRHLINKNDNKERD